jgi:hypothetical protein
MDQPTALAAIVSLPTRSPVTCQMRCSLFDLHDVRYRLDPRLEHFQRDLVPWVEAFGHDVNNFTCYVSQILFWLDTSRIWDSRALVLVSAMTEAALVSARCAGDAIAQVVGYVACDKPNQAPRGSLNDLLTWYRRNPNRVRADVALVLEGDWAWFDRCRSLRDDIIHFGDQAVIGTDGRQFYLRMTTGREWIPLLPILRDLIVSVIAAADAVGIVAARHLGLPADRIGSRVYVGTLIPAYHELLAVADTYGKPQALPPSCAQAPDERA